MKSPITTDEIIALGVLIASLIFSRYPILSVVAGLSTTYLLICVFFRKYEDARRRLKD